jgi:hypothetical protein
MKMTVSTVCYMGRTFISIADMIITLQSWALNSDSKEAKEEFRQLAEQLNSLR